MPVDCSELSQLYQQPVVAVLRPTFIGKLCYKLPSVVTFIFIQTFDQNFVFFSERRHVDRRCDEKFFVTSGDTIWDEYNHKWYRWIPWVGFLNSVQ